MAPNNQLINQLINQTIKYEKQPDIFRACRQREIIRTQMTSYQNLSLMLKES